MQTKQAASRVTPVAVTRNRSWKTPLIMGVGVVIIPIAVLTREIVAADKCVAKGGAYDYLRALCDMTGGTYVPFAESHGPLVWVGALLFLKLSAITLLAFWTPPFLTRIPGVSRILFVKPSSS